MPRRVVRRTASEVADLARDRDYVLSRRQLAALGWNHDHVQRAVAAGKWASYGSRAVVLHRGRLTTRQARWVAVVNGGPRATLAGLTAAAELGLTGFETPTIHLVIPRDGCVPSRQPGVKIHISRRFTVAHRHPARLLPTVSIERALVDGATWTANLRRAAAIMLAGIQQRLTTPEALRRELEAAGAVRHRRLLAAVLSDADGGVHALSELDFARLCRRHGLPEPTRQVRRCDALGRLRYLDVRLVGFDGRVLNLEIDGAAHYRVHDAHADVERDLALFSVGESTVRIPAYVIRAEPALIAEHLRRILVRPAA